MKKPSICHPQLAHYAKGLCKRCYDLRRVSDPEIKARRDKQLEAWIDKRPQYKYMSHRAWKLKNHYGLSVDDYERMQQNQKGVCKICQKPPGKRRLAVDHCHTNNKVRALLCASCNTLLGVIENAAWRKLAEAYLLEYA